MRVSSIHDIAATVRGRRLALGLSQAEVARIAGVSRQWVSEFESGKAAAELQLVMRLLDALGLAISLSALDAAPGELPPVTQPVDLDELFDKYRTP